MTRENFKFNAEIEKIFNLMVHALYENKDIFIRELISNASDACDKLRYEMLKNPELKRTGDDFKILVSVDKEKRLIVISDNGIGMNKEALKDNLGTIARSGTQKFLETLTGDKKKDNQLIGQFGVGFYSAFMVADNVNVISQSIGEEKAYIWNSAGDGNFTIEESPASIGNGTIITLHIKEGEDEFLDKFRVKSIVQGFSNHVAFNIYFKEEDGLETLLNSGQAIWTKNKSEIKDEEYLEFYKSISALGDDVPWKTLHYKGEGMIEYSSLFYIPSKKPFDLFHPDRLTRIKLYIKRVLISEKLEVIPQYLRFIRGVIDSADLPLNISRETIQNSAALNKIKTSITKKILKDLERDLKNDRERYIEFWNNFGAVVKEGLCDGLEPRDEILETCLFQTNTNENLISLAEYKARMKENQKSIYFITAPDRKTALASPQIEGFVKRGYEVILLTDSVDDFWVSVVHEYDGVSFKSVTKAGADLETDEKSNNSNFGDDGKEKDGNTSENKTNNNSENEEKLISFIKKVLSDSVMEVRKTSRLAESPVCLTVPEGGMDIRLERFMIENKQLLNARPKIFEINAEHNIIKKLANDVANDGFEGDLQLKEKCENTIKLLYAQANIVEGEPVPDIKEFTSYMNKLISESLAA